MMEKRKMISGGFIQGIEQEEIEKQVSDVKELDRNENVFEKYNYLRKRWK